MGSGLTASTDAGPSFRARVQNVVYLGLRLLILIQGEGCRVQGTVTMARRWSVSKAPAGWSASRNA